MLLGWIFSYFLGSMNFSWLLAYFFLKVELNNSGSGNSGATNAFRHNKLVGFFALILDVFKGFLACYWFGLGGGFFAILGHVFNFLPYARGKGVACFLGTLLTYDFNVAIVFIIFWFFFFCTFKKAGIASCLAIMANLLISFTENEVFFFFSLVSGLVIIFKHQKNIKDFFTELY